jgi:hypothetical protein
MKVSYWSDTTAPRYSLLFAFPLLLGYEVLAWSLGGGGQTGIRNGADVLLKSLFLGLGGKHGLTIFTLVLLGTGAFLVIQDLRRSGRPLLRVFGGMMLESVAYALMLGGVAGLLTNILLTGRLAILSGQLAQFDLSTQFMVSLGAGIYEELLFRVLIVTGLMALARRVFGWAKVPSGIFAAVLGALVFSGFHYVGPYGDPFQVGSFTFRAVAGLLFSGLYIVRGFGVTAWSHALYDVFLSLG